VSYLRDAVRALRAAPLVSAIAALSLALGIGGTTTIFSIVESLVLRKLPVQHADRLAVVREADKDRPWSNAVWEQIRDREDLFDGAAAWSATRFNLANEGESDFVEGVWTSGSYFQTLGVAPVLGRLFSAEQDRQAGGADGPVAVVGYGFWQRRLGGASDVIGRPITVDGVTHTIIGVTSRGFLGAKVGNEFEVAIPIATAAAHGAKGLLGGTTSWLAVMVRLKPGQTVDGGTAALRIAQPRIREATLHLVNPRSAPTHLTEPFLLRSAAHGSSFLRDQYQRPLMTILVIVGFVMLIACGNIANLLLARAAARRHELSVRTALGATPGRVARQLLTESALLALIGTFVGLAIANWGTELLIRQLSTETNTVVLDLSANIPVLLFTITMAAGTALFCGTVPALRASRVQPIEAIKESGRGSNGESGMAVSRGLVVAQVALSLALVVGAGLLLRTFARLAAVDLGFDRENLIAVHFAATRSEPSQRVVLYEQVRQAALTVPGVVSAATSRITPVSGSTWNGPVELIGGREVAEKDRTASMNLISPRWFVTYGTPLLTGRDFEAHDRSGAPQVAIVNQSFARRFLDGANPVGRMVRLPGRPDSTAVAEIVGLVGDATYRYPRDPVPATVYLPMAQQPTIESGTTVSVRLHGPLSEGMARSLRTAIMDVDGNARVTFRTFDVRIDEALARERIVAMLGAFFGILALVLAALGLYGVTSHSVNRRRREIGVRLALGTTRVGVARLVLGDVARQVAIGIGIGLLICWLATRSLESLLFELGPRDPFTLVAATGMLAVVSLVAALAPLWRAVSIDPAGVLRDG
jgi:predicted permease